MNYIAFPLPFADEALQKVGKRGRIIQIFLEVWHGWVARQKGIPINSGSSTVMLHPWDRKKSERGIFFVKKKRKFPVEFYSFETFSLHSSKDSSAFEDLSLPLKRQINFFAMSWGRKKHCWTETCFEKKVRLLSGNPIVLYIEPLLLLVKEFYTTYVVCNFAMESTYSVCTVRLWNGQVNVY